MESKSYRHDTIAQDERDRKELLEVLDDIKETEEQRRLNHLYSVAQEAHKRIPYDRNDFYLVLVKTNERDELGKPIDRVFVRLSCPTPGYNMDVFKYHIRSSSLEYLFSIPRQYRYWKIWHNKYKYLANPQTRRLATFVISMQTGDLLNWVKKECGELKDAVISVKGYKTPEIITEA